MALPFSREHGTTTDVAKLNKFQKLAALMVMLGPEGAAKILGSLDRPEAEAISMEMAKMPTVDADLQCEILREFSDVALAAGTSLRGGAAFTAPALEKAIGPQKATNTISRVTSSRPVFGAMRQVVELDSRELCSLLKGEQPQTIALIASYLTADKASQLVSVLRPELRDPVVERLATLGPTSIEVVDRVAEIIIQKMNGRSTRLVNQTGGSNPPPISPKHLEQDEALV